MDAFRAVARRIGVTSARLNGSSNRIVDDGLLNGELQLCLHQF